MVLIVLAHVWTFFSQFPKFSHIAPLKRVRKQFPVLSPGPILHPKFFCSRYKIFSFISSVSFYNIKYVWSIKQNQSQHTASWKHTGRKQPHNHRHIHSTQMMLNRLCERNKMKETQRDILRELNSQLCQVTLGSRRLWSVSNAKRELFIILSFCKELPKTFNEAKLGYSIPICDWFWVIPTFWKLSVGFHQSASDFKPLSIFFKKTLNIVHFSVHLQPHIFKMVLWRQTLCRVTHCVYKQLYNQDTTGLLHFLSM